MKYLAVLLILIGCTKEPMTYEGAKFQVGDCLKHVIEGDSNEDNEFIKEKDEPYIIYTKVEKIGKKNYLLRYGEKTLSELPIKYVDADRTKVDCSEAGF